jgi:hypothetical protein
MEQVTVVPIALFASGVVANTLRKNQKLLGHKEGIFNNIQSTAAFET